MASRPAPIVPTARAVTLLALAAPVALVIAAARPEAWIVAPFAGLLVLVFVFVDALLAGRLEDLRVISPADVEVGAEAQVTAQARIGGIPRAPEVALECDPRLATGGRLDFTLSGKKSDWTGATSFSPSRRGTGRIERVWLRWTGPLGLGARQVVGTVGQDVRVWPNVAAVRSPALQTFLKDAQFGLIARRIRGEGAQFEALAEYQPGMDRRRIDWKSSARCSDIGTLKFFKQQGCFAACPVVWVIERRAQVSHHERTANHGKHN